MIYLFQKKKEEMKNLRKEKEELMRKSKEISERVLLVNTRNSIS